MSYCRFSSDDWTSNVYAYQSSSGYEMHVAAYKYSVPIPKLPPYPDGGTKDVGWDKYWKVYHEQMAVVSSAPKEKIGLPFDGELLVYPTEKAMISAMRELRRIGYHVPAYMFVESDRIMRRRLSALVATALCILIALYLVLNG